MKVIKMITSLMSHLLRELERLRLAPLPYLLSKVLQVQVSLHIVWGKTVSLKSVMLLQ